MQKETRSKLSNIWLKASVVGSLWASLEIIIGSFLHNLRIPFTGTMLGVMGVILLIAFHQLWNDKGLFWRSGLICALMKSISPSAVILGPMIGIFSEAFLLEIFVLLFGRNLFGYLIGGICAVLTTLIQKVLGFLIVYGFDIVKIITNLYYFALKQINIKDLNPVYLILLIIFIYILFGIFAAIFGYYVGKKTIHGKNSWSSGQKLELNSKKKIFGNELKQQFSVFLLFMHLIIIFIGLITINFSPFIFSLSILLLYTGFCIYKYRNSLRILKKPFFWIQLLIIILLSAIFWKGSQKEVLFDVEGIIVGIKICIRALIIIIGFVGISVELRNPLVKTLLYKKGFSQLYLSLGLAFSALPSIIDNIARPKQVIKTPIKTLANLIINANELLKEFETANQYKHPGIFIITGQRNQGKTTFAKKIVTKLKVQGITVGGFIAEAINKDNIRAGFNLVDIQTDKSIQLCNINGSEKWHKTGQFYFNPEGLEFGYKLLEPDNLQKAELVIIDEIGHLELNNNGWKKSIDNLLKNSNIPMIWIIRESLVKDVLNKWDIRNSKIFNISSNDEKTVFNIISSYMAANSFPLKK